MNTFTDYYTLLEVDPQASSDEVRAAFKKLALKYHPDVYKGSDAEERMRQLLEAYQTLNDTQKRRAYDLIRSEHVQDARSYSRPNVTSTSAASRARNNGTRQGNVVTPKARRDRQRHYAFPDLKADQSTSFNLGDFSYSLEPLQALQLQQDGMLRGAAPTSQRGREREQGLYHCHRCQHQWKPVLVEGLRLDDTCPHCHSNDWSEFLLLHCMHCAAVFESEQIRYEIGAYNYGGGALCPPYELFPLCPYCGAANWCPAENVRVDELRAKAAQRDALIFWLRVGLVSVILLGVFFVVLSSLH